ncbi:Uncharacterised protein [Mycobacteroides abscessus]|nr:Uncharacterised protein [Mycobacteroides abscessus]
MQQDYRWPIGRPLVDVADIEQPGIDLFEGRKLGARACRVDTGTIRARPECGAPTAVASATLENPRLLIMSGTDSVSDPLASTIRGNDGVGLYRARVARRG